MGDQTISREAFLQQYLTLMAEINRQQNCLLWWATDISSKNRFNTPIPGLLEQLVKGDPAGPSHLREVGRSVKYVLRWVKSCATMMWRAILARMVLGAKVGRQLKKTDEYVVLKSIAYPQSLAENGRYKDAFFGRLPEFLKTKGPLLVVVDLQAGFDADLQKLAKVSDTLVVPWEYFLKLRDILSFTARGIFYQPRRLDHLFFGDMEVTKALDSLWHYGACRIQPYQLFHYPAFENLCRTIKVKRLISTYESNPWEKMMILAVRKNAPLAKIVGYQHNIVPQASANIFIDAGEPGVTPLPDKIITTGEEPKRLLEKFSNYPSGMLQTGCSLRVELGFNEKAKHQRIRKVLVALEGVDAAHALAKYAIEELKGAKDLKVIIRTHPLLPWPYYQKKYGYDLSGYPHLRLSQKTSLKEDIAQADVVLYWGSAVGVEALSFGKPVVHLENGSLLSFDPIFACPYLKWTTREGLSLREIFASIDALSDAEFEQSRSMAEAYLKDYFHPVTEQALNSFVN